MNYISEIQGIYYQFLNYFPASFQPIVSIILGVIIIYAVFRIIEKDFVWIIALVVLVPGSVAILESIWGGLLTVLKFLFGMS